METEKNIDELSKWDTYRVVSPYKSNGDIFNTEKYDVEVIKKKGFKLVIIQNKNEKENVVS